MASTSCGSIGRLSCVGPGATLGDAEDLAGRLDDLAGDVGRLRRRQPGDDRGHPLGPKRASISSGSPRSSVSRVSAPGAIGVDGDAVAAELFGGDQGEGGDAGLGGAVVGLAGLP